MEQEISIDLSLDPDHLTPEQWQLLRLHVDFIERMAFLDQQMHRSTAWALAIAGTLVALVFLDWFDPAPDRFVSVLISLVGVVALVPGLVCGPPQFPPTSETSNGLHRNAVATWYGMWALAGLQGVMIAYTLWRLL